MSYTAHHRSHHGACSPEACGGGVWASRDPQAVTSGQAATATHTPDRHHGATHLERAESDATLPAFGLTLATAFRDRDGPVHKDTAGSPSRSRNHAHPSRAPTTMS
jgi:hypothetical protein